MTRVARDVGWRVKTWAYADGRVAIRISNPNQKSGQAIIYERAARAKLGATGTIQPGEWYFRVSRGGGKRVIRVGTLRIY